MQTKYTYKEIWLIAYPILISLLMEQMIGMTDTAFLGRVGEIELGASAIAGIFYIVMFMVAFGFSIGAQILIARRNGEQQYKEIGNLFYQGIYFQLGMAAVMFIVCYCFAPVILKRLVSSEHIYNAAMSYLNWRVFGFFFSFTAVMFRAFFLGTTQTKTLTLNSIVMVLSNIIFNYVLIFGKWGFPEMGVGGAALASVCAEISATFFFIGYTLVKLPLKTYSLFYFHKLEGWLMKSVLKLAFPTMIQKLLSFGTWFIFFALVEHMGETPIAVSGIVRSVYMLVMIPVFAFGATANTLTSRLIGEGKQNEVMPTVFKTIGQGLIAILPVLLCCLFIPHTVLSIYTDDLVLADASIPSLLVICCASIAMSFGIPLFEAVSGTGNTTNALILESVVLIAYTFSVWFFASYISTRVEWVWTSEFTYGTLIGLVSWLFMRFASWQRKKI